MTMKQFAVALLALSILGSSAAAEADVTGDYVEARSCSVFAGACHYGGEYDNEGRDAIMAWHFSAGEYRGVSLAGLSLVAVVKADRNLAEAGTQTTAVLYVPSNASVTQVDAMRTLSGLHVNKVVRTDVAFERTKDDAFAVTVPQTVTLNVKALPDRACCLQPNLVWYQPLTPVQDRRVGLTEAAVAPDWSRHHENDAFYGSVSYR
jgi:hypothetical protein